MSNKPVHIDSIAALHELAELPSPNHPLISVVNIEDIPFDSNKLPSELTYSFYSIGLKRNMKGYMRYGRKTYDFQKGVFGFTAPNQILSFDDIDITGASGWMLLFHPDLLTNHALFSKINSYGFFNYDINEALHLSKTEELGLESLFVNINEEYGLPIDKFSKNVILSNLELLFTYAERYYARQFITRSEVDSDFVNKFRKILTNYFDDNLQLSHGLPTVSYLGGRMNVSPNYLGDLLKTLTGKSTQEYIHLEIIRLAKNALGNSELSVSQIAYQLGFDYPQYFSRLFKEKTGQTPKEFQVNTRN